MRLTLFGPSPTSQNSPPCSGQTWTCERRGKPAQGMHRDRLHLPSLELRPRRPLAEPVPVPAADRALSQVTAIAELTAAATRE